MSEAEREGRPAFLKSTREMDHVPKPLWRRQPSVGLEILVVSRGALLTAQMVPRRGSAALEPESANLHPHRAFPGVDDTRWKIPGFDRVFWTHCAAGGSGGSGSAEEGGGSGMRGMPLRRTNSAANSEGACRAASLVYRRTDSDSQRPWSCTASARQPRERALGLRSSAASGRTPARYRPASPRLPESGRRR